MSLPDNVSPEYQDEESIRIAAELNEAMRAVNELKASIAAEEESKKEFLAEAERARAAFDEAQRKAKAIDAKMWEAKKAIREAERRAESEERRLQMALENQRLRADFLRVQDEFDRIMQGFDYIAYAMDHQVDGAKRLAYAERGVLADTMGLGKTLTSLMTADLLGAKKVLIVAPATVVKSFEAEIARWVPHRTLVSLAGLTKLERRFATGVLPGLSEFIVTINYEAWRKDTAFVEALSAARFEMVILDEAHNIKDMESLAFRGVEKIIYAENLSPEEAMHPSRDGLTYRSCSVRYVYPMTGTPILNKPEELFSILNLVDRRNFYNKYNFLRDYCIQDWETGRWNFRPGGLDSLAKKISARFIRRTKESAGIKLPEKTIQVHTLTLDPDIHPNQYRACQELNKHAAIMLDEDRTLTVSAMIALITRKRQAITWPAGIELKDQDGVVVLKVDIEESVKVDAAMDLLEEVILDEKVVIFSQFKAPLRELARRIKARGYNVETIDGDTPVAERAGIIDRFQNMKIHESGGVDVILGNYKAMGVGVTLTAATQMIILDEEWNPGKNEQAYDRIHRIGQDKPVTIHILRVENSVDTWMAAINDEKAQLVDGFITATDMAAELRNQILGGGMI